MEHILILDSGKFLIISSRRDKVRNSKNPDSATWSKSDPEWYYVSNSNEEPSVRKGNCFT